jgi:hypothetical protein
LKWTLKKLYFAIKKILLEFELLDFCLKVFWLKDFFLAIYFCLKPFIL